MKSLPFYISRVPGKNWYPGVIIFLFLTGCAGLQLKEPMVEGEKLYRQKCASCHRLLPKEEYSKEKWRESVEKYGNNINLTPEEKNKILKYLTEDK